MSGIIIRGAIVVIEYGRINFFLYKICWIFIYHQILSKLQNFLQRCMLLTLFIEVIDNGIEQTRSRSIIL